MTEDKVTQLPAVRQPREVRVTEDAIAIYDTAKFEMMQRIAGMMAKAPLVPMHLRCLAKQKDASGSWAILETGTMEEAVANCFLVVNQAHNWSMDPFAVAQETFVTPSGQIGFSGKLVNAALQRKLGFDLDMEFFGDPGKDSFGVRVSFTLPGKAAPSSIEGTVGEWKTATKSGGTKPLWVGASNQRKMLAYRGVREWCRAYRPGVILGVTTDDEMSEAVERQVALRGSSIAKPMSEIAAPRPQLPPPQESGAGTPGGAAPDQTSRGAGAAPAIEEDEPIATVGRSMVGATVPTGKVKVIPPRPPSGEPQSQPGPQAPAKHSAPSKPAAKARPEYESDPNAWLQWVDSVLEEITPEMFEQDGEILNTTWNEKIDPTMPERGMFPPDYDEAIGIFRKHERRLAPEEDATQAGE